MRYDGKKLQCTMQQNILGLVCDRFTHFFFFLNHIMPIIVSDDGEGMFCFQCLTDAYVHGATQNDESPPPCMRLQAVVLTYPPPRLYMQARVGFFLPM
jgi:hypothetical protein